MSVRITSIGELPILGYPRHGEGYKGYEDERLDVNS